MLNRIGLPSFSELIMYALERCDYNSLMSLRKDILVELNKSAGLSHGNRNKDVLVEQLMNLKGCYCHFIVKKACQVLPQALMYATIAGGLYYADRVAGNHYTPRGAFGLDHQGFAREMLNEVAMSRGLTRDEYTNRRIAELTRDKFWQFLGY